MLFKYIQSYAIKSTVMHSCMRGMQTFGSGMASVEEHEQRARTEVTSAAEHVPATDVTETTASVSSST